MKALENESNLLNIIKYGPIFFVIIISFIVTQFFLYEKNTYFNNEIKIVEKTFFEENKKSVKNEVESVYNLIKKEKDRSEKNLKKMLKNRVNEAYQIAQNIYTEESKKDFQGHFHSKEHIFNTIKNALGGILYNEGRGYFFISDIKGRLLLQPLNKDLEGKDFLNYTDANGYQFAKKIVKTIKNKTQSYDTYSWYKENDKFNAYKKISFYKYFEPFNVAIGTGEYIKDFEKELQKKLLERIKEINFRNNGYIFVYDLNANSLSHPINKLNKVDNKLQSKNRKNIINDILKYAKNNQSGFIEYSIISKTNESFKSGNKISYVSLFDDWNWVIGGGFYLKELEDKIKKRKEILIQSKDESVKKIIFMSLVITGIFILLSFYISKVIAFRFNKYRINIKKEAQKTIEKEKLLIQQSKMATMGEMIGNIAHQWKQPLSVISTSNDMVRMNKEMDNIFDEKDLEQAHEAIDNAVQNLSETIDDFRNFFNPNKKGTLFNVQDVFVKTHKLISSQFKNNDIELIESFESIELNAYENELSQTLINLLKNAKEELVKKDYRRIIFIDVFKKDNQVIIQIKDNAGGIPDDIIDKVFNAYFTTKEESGGTGIGLYMSKQIIENMNGEIIVSNEEYEYESVMYKGALFTIKLNLQ